MAAAPPNRFPLGDDLVLLRYRIKDAAALSAAVTANLDHLRPWMPWIGFEPLTLTARRDLLRGWQAAWRDGSAFQFGLFNDGRLIGSSGLMRRLEPHQLEIGYWVAADANGRGLATAMARELAIAGLGVDGTTEIVIRHDKANDRSGAIPRVLGFNLRGEEPSEIEAPSETGVQCWWVLDAAGAARLDAASSA